MNSVVQALMVLALCQYLGYSGGFSAIALTIYVLHRFLSYAIKMGIIWTKMDIKVR